jgi:hypothetical protein
MAKERTKNPANRKRARKKASAEAVYYVVEIEDWDWSLSFGLQSMRGHEDPYSDYRHLNMRGKLIRPSKLECHKVELSFLPDTRLNEDMRKQHTPVSVGSLNLCQGNMYGLLCIPSDAVSPLLTIATAGELRYIVMHGDKLRYGSARIKGFRVEMHIDEDDLGDA